MSLSDRVLSIIKKIKPGFILMIPVFLGCETSDDIGILYELESEANVRYVELVLPSTNVYVDSLRTDGENSILVGQYQDDISGMIGTESYFSMKYYSDNVPDEVVFEELLYESVRMSFLSPFKTGNGISNQSFNVHLLADTIPNVVYLSSNTQTLSEEIGTFESAILPDTNYFNFPLYDDFGIQLLDRFLLYDPLIGSTDWPSLAISPNISSEAINQFTLNADTSRIFLYLTEPEGATQFNVVGNDTINLDTTYVVEFRFDPFLNQFNEAMQNPHYVSIDRSGVNTSIPDNISVIDVIAGITTSISTQPLQDFIDQQISEERTIIINNATLSFTFESEINRDTLENFYSFFYRNEDYFAPALVTNPFSNLIMSDNAYLLNSNTPALSVLNTERNQMIVNATLFFQSLYSDYLNNSETSNFLVRDSDEVSLTDFILIGQSEINLQQSIFVNDGIKLEIYYTEVN